MLITSNCVFAKDSDERSVAIAVRIHKTLELADDKYYMITCGQAGFQNLENKTSLVTLELLREGRKLEQVVYGREYMLRWEREMSFTVLSDTETLQGPHLSVRWQCRYAS